MLHIPRPPVAAREMLFLFCDFFWIGRGRRRRRKVNQRLIVSILVIAAASVCAQAQNSTPAKVSKADAQAVFKIISGDKAKTRIYCEMAKLGERMEQANERGEASKFDRVFEKMYELGKKLGPEYNAMIDGLQDIDPESEVGREVTSTLDALDNLCSG